MEEVEMFPARLWPFQSIIRTSASPEECAERLAAVTCRSYEDSKELAGEFDRKGGWLSPASRNVLQSRLTLEFHPRGSGTDIDGSTRGDELQFLVGLAFLFIVTPAALVFLWANLTTSLPEGLTFDDILPIAIPILMVVVGAPHAFRVRKAAQRHHEAFMGFVAETVGGTVVQDAAPATAARSARSIVE